MEEELISTVVPPTVSSSESTLGTTGALAIQSTHAVLGKDTTMTALL